MFAAILVIGLIALVVGLMILNRGPAEPEDHQPLIMRDGSQLQLAGGRHRLRAKSAGGDAGGGFTGGGDGGGGCGGGDGGGCS